MTSDEDTATSEDPGSGQPAPGSGAVRGQPETASGPAVPAAGDAEQESARGRSFWRELPVLIVVALVIALIIKTFVVQAFFIPSGSMQNTLAIGDKVLVNKLAYHFRPIHPGDIVVFDGAGSWNAPVATTPSRSPLARLYDETLLPLGRSIAGLFGTAPGQTDYIKRVIGVPGDHVACCNAQGLVTINGVPLHEKSYLYPGNTPGDAPIGEAGRFSLTVPPGRLWVLGDHRAISDDSRGHVDDPGNGTIPENKVIGRAFLIVWPPSHWRVLRIPATFDQAGITGKAAALGATAPVLPLGAGLAGAVPVALLGRRFRLRRRVRRRRAR